MNAASHFFLAILVPVAMGCVNVYIYLGYGHNPISMASAIFCGVIAIPGILRQGRL